MNESTLQPGLLPQSKLWHMALRLGPESIEALFLPPVSSHPPVWRSVEVSQSSPSRLKDVQDAIYDNPLLLSEFKAIDCVVATSRALMLPRAIADDEQLAKAAIETVWDHPADHLHVAECGVENAVAVMALDRETESFLTRTFYDVRLSHPLGLLTKMVSLQSAESPVMLASCRRGGVDVVACSGKRLLLANSFSSEVTVDTLYYIAACLNQLGRSEKCNVALRICGSAELLAEARRLLPHHDPAPFVLPSELWGAGSEANNIPPELLAVTL